MQCSDTLSGAGTALMKCSDTLPGAGTALYSVQIQIGRAHV
jgi:hypothetical protein